MKRDENEYLDSIFNNYYNILCNISRYYVARDIAQDIVQEVIISFWNKIKNGLILDGDTLPYLKGAVIKKSLQFVRDNKIIICDIENEIVESYEDYDFSDDAKRETILQELNELIETLSPQCKKIFNMIVMERKSYKDVAHELNISLNSVKTQHSRAMKKIRNTNKKLYAFIVLFRSF